jgi:hypothetical protein
MMDVDFWVEFMLPGKIMIIPMGNQSSGQRIKKRLTLCAFRPMPKQLRAENVE